MAHRTEAQKEADRRYRETHGRSDASTVLSFTILKTEAAPFREAVEASGMTMGMVLKALIKAWLNGDIVIQK